MVIEATAPSGTKGFFKVVGVDYNGIAMVEVQGGILPQTSQLAGTAVATFQIGRTEVTWHEWQKVRAWALANGYSDLAGVGAGIEDTHPVRGVNFKDALKWCNARSEKDGLTPVYEVNGDIYRTGDDLPSSNANANGYRLPLPIEWEWAASGGVLSKGYVYSGSNDLSAVAWANDPSAKEPKPVGTKAANELGIHDMCGNVWEWTFYPTLHRGGCWIDGYDASWFDVRAVGQGGPGHGPEYFGLRVARNAED
jgi:formylglycine-generating enzyme required for sulfatase activity